MVTTDGQQLRVDATTHADLFWGLRGGGGSVAVVTAVELRLFPLSTLTAGALSWSADQAAELVAPPRALGQATASSQRLYD